MIFSTNQPAGPAGRAPRLEPQAIVVESQPGGLYPGQLLPPTWYTRGGRPCVVPSALPAPGDRPAIVAGVVQMCSAVRDAALALHEAGAQPVLVGGDHSLAMGTLAAATARFARVAVIWIDAHADFNTMETSPSGNPHGMPLAVACGLGDERLKSLFTRYVQASDVVLIGARDIDPDEQRLLAEAGIWHVGVEGLRAQGIPELVAAIARRFDGASVHMSFDFDALSAEHFPATGTPVGAGLTPEEGEALLRAIAASPLALVSSDWVEYLPGHAQAAPSGKLARRMFDAYFGPPPAPGA